MQKFLVIQTAFIGDVVLATALLEKLHQFYPEAQIDFLVRKGNEELFANHPFLHELLVWNKKENKYKNLFSILNKIRGNKYDTVVNVQRFAATGMLTVFSKAKQTIGFDKNPWSFLFSKKIKHEISTSEKYIHEVDRNQKLIEKITDAFAAQPRLYPSASDFERVKQYQQTVYVCLAPASVWFTKQYPVEKWVALIGKLPAQLKIYLLGGPADKALCEKIKAASIGEDVVNLAGELNFLQSAALQSGAKMNYVNDSAPMHFASSVDAPVTAIYCSTVPSFGFGPLSSQSFIVQTKELLSCKPCGLHGYKACPLGHFKCAYTIEDEQLLEVLDN
ncbi:MAG TPA: glycosyltransferase family 9 protein [Segetibacter sp.]